MKSKLCHRGLPKDLEEGLGYLIKIDEKPFKEMMTLLGENISPEKGFMLPAEDLFISFAKENKITIPEILKIIYSIPAIMAVKEDGDEVDDLIDDLIEMGRIDKENKNDLLNKISLSEKIFINKIKHYADEQALIKSSFPTIDDLKTRIILLNTYGDSFNPRIDTPDKYEPNITDSVPLVIVRFVVDKFGEKIVEQFAITENELDEAINHLILAKKELLFFKNRLIKK